MARSTFYYHFRSKDELLLQNFAPMFAALSRLAVADTPSPRSPPGPRMSGSIGGGRRACSAVTGRKIATALAAEVRRALQEKSVDPAALRLAPLLADQIASGMLGIAAELDIRPRRRLSRPRSRSSCGWARAFAAVRERAPAASAQGGGVSTSSQRSAASRWVAIQAGCRLLEPHSWMRPAKSAGQ